MIDLSAHGLIAPATAPRPTGGPGTIARLLDPLLADAPDQLALVGRSARYTAAELDAATTRAANALRSLGVKPGDRVAASLPNDADIDLRMVNQRDTETAFGKATVVLPSRDGGLPIFAPVPDELARKTVHMYARHNELTAQARRGEG